MVPSPVSVSPPLPEPPPAKASAAPAPMLKVDEPGPLRVTGPATASVPAAPLPATFRVCPPMANEAMVAVPPEAGSWMVESAVTVTAFARLSVPPLVTEPATLPRSTIAPCVSAPEYCTMMPAPPPAWVYSTVIACSPGASSTVPVAVCMACGPSSLTTCWPST